MVSFIVLAYNQENYIEQAVKSALSQSYEPLEVFLTDDASKDKTFEIMKASVQAYAGPHKIVLRQNESNLGLIKHLNLAIAQASSDFIVLAAGDDISLSNRTAEIMKIFHSEKDVYLVHSMAFCIDNAGRELGIYAPPIRESRPGLGGLCKKMSIYIGATGAIRRDLFNIFGPISEEGTYEDLVFAFRARLIGDLRYIEAPLVKYRKGVGISSLIHRVRASKAKKRVERLNHKLSTFRQRLSDLQSMSISHNDPTFSILGTKIKVCEAQLSFHDSKTDFFKTLFTSFSFSHLKALLTELPRVL